MTFNEFQLLQNKVRGIKEDTTFFKNNTQNIQLYCREGRDLNLLPYDQNLAKAPSS